jgi:HAMP domain-containing protein
MSTLADVQSLYGSVRSSWTKSHAHVVSHLALALVLFMLFRVTFPQVPIPKLSATQIVDNEWFKLAKDTGVIYVSLVIPFVLAAVYVALLRTVGQLLIGVLVFVFPPDSNQNRMRLLNEWTLEPLALIMKTKDFTIGDLTSKAGELAVKYQSKKNEQWESYQRSLSGLTKNSTVYLGDFLFFLLAWIVLFRMFPHFAWVRANAPRFWPVVLVLSGLAWFAWFRVSRALRVMPGLLLMFVSTMIRTDPDMASLLEIPAEEHNAVRQRVRELLSDEQDLADRKPSLRHFILYRLGFSQEANRDQTRKSLSGWPFLSVYQQGSQFSDKPAEYDAEDWLENYLAYLYYRCWERVALIARTAVRLARYAVTGTP